MEYIAYIGLAIVIILIGVTLVTSVLWTIAEMRAEAEIKKKIAETRRTEIINGKEYSVTTKNLWVMREKRTGHIGIALERSMRSNPTTINGELAFEPIAVKIQFVRKSDRKLGAIGWRSFRRFEIIDATNVDFLTHNIGWFGTTTTYIRPDLSFINLLNIKVSKRRQR